MFRCTFYNAQHCAMYNIVLKFYMRCYYAPVHEILKKVKNQTVKIFNVERITNNPPELLKDVDRKLRENSFCFSGNWLLV